MASMGASGPDRLDATMLRRRLGPTEVRSYEELQPSLQRGRLLAEAPADWAADWRAADPDRFGVSAASD